MCELEPNDGSIEPLARIQKNWGEKEATEQGQMARELIKQILSTTTC
jgi:hypothetical protein